MTKRGLIRKEDIQIQLFAAADNMRMETFAGSFCRSENYLTSVLEQRPLMQKQMLYAEAPWTCPSVVQHTSSQSSRFREPDLDFNPLYLSGCEGGWPWMVIENA
jgi:hypothetical protein